ncbi:hypothetical protein JHU38_10595 [Prevotella sp. A2931]|uniref:Uncharacterized protein n=1 Tax=Prevotella illustrans TaxID=2800387 RepID=A0ABS3M7W6_9BACT|nr:MULTISPECIES: hypothetical protein [Prevotella]MBO1364206.1 hypothetical protein [Prevotella illustrans]PTL25396.1 hypothetical protein C3V39_12155 [Prevotella sp. oral taxon 820]
MTRNQEQITFPYSNLHDIRVQKEMLRREIQTDDIKIKALWNELFHSKQSPSSTPPSKRFSQLINTSAGILDAVILGWKLYHKFKRQR